MLLLDSGAALMARQWKRTRSWSTLTYLAFGRQPQVYQALAHTVRYGLEEAKYGLAGLVSSYSPSTLATVARSLLAAAPRANVPVIIELANFSENPRKHEFGY